MNNYIKLEKRYNICATDVINRENLVKCLYSIFDNKLDDLLEMLKDNDILGLTYTGFYTVGEEVYIISAGLKIVTWYKLYHIGRSFSTNLENLGELYLFFIKLKNELIEMEEL